MRIKDLSNKVVQLEKDIKEVEVALENVLDHPHWKELAKESDKLIVKVLYTEYNRLTGIYNKVCMTDVWLDPDDQALPEVERFFSDL